MPIQYSVHFMSELDENLVPAISGGLDQLCQYINPEISHLKHLIHYTKEEEFA